MHLVLKLGIAGLFVNFESAAFVQAEFYYPFGSRQIGSLCDLRTSNIQGDDSSEEVEIAKRRAKKKIKMEQDEVLLAFRRYPWFMSPSEKKIMRHMDFFVNKMGWDRAVIIMYPQLLGFSLEKRILPRCSVLRVLILKGLVKENRNMGSLIVKNENYFLEKFVTKYEIEVPQLLDLYKGNTSSLLVLGNGTDKVDGKNLL
ncbi:hypothetical protein NE237_024365 [Protea cynaroides]|uniref:Uncharacterized protein n=1 Tax=Protea cynaroides TaxID=273540 RepID=A0A9Q0K625_9MAGN|nr:hypothetical protein NE237_024365 [Protea cynaroides]